VGELRDDKVASLESPPEPEPAQAAANRLGIVVSELTPQQRRDSKLTHGLVVTDVRPGATADLRRGDVLLMLVHNGRQTELKSVQQLDKLLASLDKGAVFTLQVRRGESTAFVAVSGLGDGS
jgi:serine protease Do